MLKVNNYYMYLFLLLTIFLFISVKLSTAAACLFCSLITHLCLVLPVQIITEIWPDVCIIFSKHNVYNSEAWMLQLHNPESKDCVL